MRFAILAFLGGVFVSSFAIPVHGQAVQDLVPLGTPVAASVEPGRPSAVGILIPGGTGGISFSVKFAKGAGLDPEFAIRRPDGTLLDEVALRVAGVALSVSPKGIKGKGLPAPESGMYKFVIRGRNGTSGGYTLVTKGKATKPPAVAGNLADTSQVDEIPLRAASGSLLTLALKGAKGAPFLPEVTVVTASGVPLDLTGFATTSLGAFALRAFPLPWFGDYTIRIRSLGGTGGYTMKT
ncbi:MAG: hypothetical protein MUE73_17480 [Planctomycetes bacterium]|nr:hypothetical protein [Planctomycetota bacterium]